MDLYRAPLWQRRNWSTSVSTSSELLTGLAADSDISVRAGVADNCWTSPELLEQLALDHSEKVRTAVARNRRTPPEVRDQLRRDNEVTISEEASTDPTSRAGDVA
jgi:hypothetical protein